MSTYDEIIKAKRQADRELYEMGIEYDFDEDEYVDGDDIIPKEKIAESQRARMSELLGRTFE